MDVVGVNVDSGISLSANQGIGFFLNTAGVGFFSEVKIGGSTTTVRCVFKFSNKKLRCKARLGWGELFLSGSKYVLNKINDFAGNGAQEVAQFYSNRVGGVGKKFAKSIVNHGKKVTNKVKCKLSNLLGGKCGKNGGNPSSCGDGTEYVIRNEQDKCLMPSPRCYEPSGDGKVYYFGRKQLFRKAATEDNRSRLCHAVAFIDCLALYTIQQTPSTGALQSHLCRWTRSHEKGCPILASSFAMYPCCREEPRG